ncbi:phage tail assembly chaperone [Phyllobacterium phragmitis]|uniref:Phage tail assembly chaperone n=1 Tax=Phyllobacterium phragmitis TaxID=2670329 RepID=A0A2S9IP50_9HYPH|nr:phage tail assembly chaperone [Phyllobacterium phragmitis]PRD42306.1 phage tail assembly chaperone [Phyllobacterium phragmitis]
MDLLPWRQWQEIAYGALRWTPDVFWRSTLSELVIAIDGYCEAKGIEKSKAAAPSKDEIDALLAKYG